ncbi:hypothetical protein V1460_25510 [Streptomyces sp. SCSIO 30461]|uniref:hypothetical protein n=1 Tax=Streptomyces sp. SCSIO 30461 TaxID=3118085 RepID=UPI0030D403FE
MFTYINDYAPCRGEYSHLVNDNEAMVTANGAFIDGNEEGPADWRIKSIDSKRRRRAAVPEPRRAPDRLLLEVPDRRTLALHPDRHPLHRDQGELTMREPKFNPPYGGAISHVTDPAEHHGYLHMVAWAVEIGSHAEYIKDWCAKAKSAGAPLDTLYERSGPCGIGTGEWVRFSDIDTTGHDSARGFVRIEQYVKELVRYQHAVTQYRKWHRKAPALKTFTVTITAPITTTVRALDEEDARRTALAGWAQNPDSTATARLTGPPGAWLATLNGIPNVIEVRKHESDRQSRFGTRNDKAFDQRS